MNPLLQRAQAAALLPAGARWPSAEHRPWPVLALTALGAWFVAVPLLAFIAALLGPLAQESTGQLLVGLALLVLAMTLLRRPESPLFVEQLALPLLLLGLLCIGWGLHQALGQRPAFATLALLGIALAGGLSRPWLRTLLGLMVGACLLALVGWRGLHLLWTASGLVAAWVLLSLLPLPGRLARLWDRLGAGVLCAALLTLAAHSGSPWLVAGISPLGAWGASATASLAAALVSIGLLLAAGGLLAHRQAALRRPLWAVLLLPLLGLTGLLPALGAVALAGAAAWTLGQRRLAVLGALAALWVLGSFYYQVQWPLIDKAAWLAAFGAALLLWARLAHRRLRLPTPADTPTAPTRALWTAAALALGGTLLAVNLGIAEKEQLIANGQPLFVRLAPADPRSLMQGDYMRLAFEVPAHLAGPAPGHPDERPRLVVRTDTEHRATAWRRADGTPLAPDERAVHLAFKNGRWILVTDAWFFAEGEAERWAQARWGEFRVAPNGQALLVSLRGEALQAL